MRNGLPSHGARPHRGGGYRPGFPGGFSERAFEPFARGAQNDGDGGAGLGLAIVQAVARGHGGSAVAEKRPGGGSRLTLTLREEEGGKTRPPPVVSFDQAPELPGCRGPAPKPLMVEVTLKFLSIFTVTTLPSDFVTCAS
jgi:hypothetical protein